MELTPEPGSLTPAGWSKPKPAYVSPPLGASAYLHYFYNQRRNPITPASGAVQGAADTGDAEPSTALEDALRALIRDTFG